MTAPQPADAADPASAPRDVLERLPHLGDGELRPVQLAELYARLAATAAARAEFYGRLLAQAYQDKGMDALIGAKVDGAVVGGGRDGVPNLELYQTGEEVRALVALEAQERDRAERLAREAIKLGVEASRVDVMRSYGRTVAQVTQAFSVELGLNWADPAVRRAAQRAVLRARQSLGFDFRAPESIGPALTQDERDRVLDRVLDRAPAPFDQRGTEAAEATETGQEDDSNATD